MLSQIVLAAALLNMAVFGAVIALRSVAWSGSSRSRS